MGLLRTFVALPCGRAASERLSREAARLAGLDPGLRAPRESALHLTVQFLGAVQEEEIVDLCRAVGEAAATSGPIQVRYRGLGAFPDPERARVVWVGLEDGSGGALSALAAELGGRLAALGHPPDPRAWSPHITLGRLKARPAGPLVSAVRAGGALDLGSEILSDLKLILSRPEGGRYHYIDLTTAPLGPRPESA
jgi:2'-5' RNA ligase